MMLLFLIVLHHELHLYKTVSLYRYMYVSDPFMDHTLVVMKGLVLLSEALNHAMQGHPRRTGHSKEFYKTWHTGGGNSKPLQ